MGTSQSKPSAGSGKPLVPSWADHDTLLTAGTPILPATPAQQTPQQQEVFDPRRLAGFRRSLKTFMTSGDKSDLSRALGHFSRKSTAGGAIGGQRFARAARVGGAVLAALSDAANGGLATAKVFDLSDLNGQPLENAISAIIEEFCSPGIIDEDVLRSSMGEALAEALSGNDPFDATSIDEETVALAIKAFVAELVFYAVVSEQGQAAEDVSPQQAIDRENDVRGLIREVTDLQATPIIGTNATAFSAMKVSAMVKAIATNVFEEMSQW